MPTISEALTHAAQQHRAGHFQIAEQLYRQILAADPNRVEAWHCLGSLALQYGQHSVAAEYFARAIKLKPDLAEAHYLLGNACKSLGRLDEAATSYGRSLELLPGQAEVHNNLGNVLQTQGKTEEAIANYRLALKFNSNFAEAYSNLGFTLQNQGELGEALDCYSKALSLKPGYVQAHCNRAIIWLLLGEWDRGWPEYEWRLQMREFGLRRLAQPAWLGESVAGKTILLHAEQGLGDTIQFIRYASIVKRLGAAAVIVECQPALLGLLEGCSGIDRLVPRNAELPAFDVHAPLLSVPGILKTSVSTAPSSVPYLAPKEVISERWQKELCSIEGFKIGIIWHGNPGYIHDRSRSIPLCYFASLAQLPGVSLISLQKGVNSEQPAKISDLFPIINLSDDLDRQTPFLDTAAVMKNLDLVISVDAAPAHLAGALGVPTWLALAAVPSWRWLLDRSDSPWYPSVRLFRQRERGIWDDVFAEMKKTLIDLLSQKSI